MEVLVTGGTGFVGRTLVERLVARGDRVTITSRDPSRQPARNGVAFARIDAPIAGPRAIVSLAGASIAGRRWTAEYERELVASRVDATRSLVERIARASPRPDVLVSASAVGIFGDRGDEPLDESSSPGADFLADLCVRWEAEARRAEELGVRVVLARLGIVLGRSGGALAQMLPVFRLGLGGPFGSGRAWFPWVHVDDVARLVLFAIDTPGVSGPLLAVSPGIVTNRDFARALGRALHRPAILPVPRLALRIVVGKAASALVASQRALPRRTQDAGFAFEHRELGPTLDALVARS